jgi:hypothetical protein
LSNTSPRPRPEPRVMADTKNTEVLPAYEPPASVPTAAPVTVVSEKRNWATPLTAALVVVVTLVVGGVGGFALARATVPGGDRQSIQQGQLPGGPGGGQQGQQGGPQQGPGGQQGGPQQGGPQQGPGGQQNQPPRPDGDNQDDSTDDSTDESGESGEEAEN